MLFPSFGCIEHEEVITVIRLELLDLAIQYILVEPR
jgi:hypothetical protein